MQGRGKHPPAVNRVNLSSMSSEVLLDSYQGKQFNSPNDVVLYCDGSIWFTGEAATQQLICSAHSLFEAHCVDDVLAAPAAGG
jgi:sugar lactone lactonase YvrE